MARELREDIEEVVLQALGNRERRNILDVVASSENGVLYSDILHELGVNTGKLNYHLKLLEGIIEKDDSRRYGARAPEGAHRGPGRRVGA
jgi:predicted transcriptional regulator